MRRKSVALAVYFSRTFNEEILYALDQNLSDEVVIELEICASGRQFDIRIWFNPRRQSPCFKFIPSNTTAIVAFSLIHFFANYTHYKPDILLHIHHQCCCGFRGWPAVRHHHCDH
jgi:hypothetical protein